MPVPRSVGAPIFEGRYVHDFLNIIESLANAAGKSKAEYPSLILPYCSDEIKRSIEYADEFIGTDWQAAKEFLIQLYESSDLGPASSIDQLRAYIQESQGKTEFTKRLDLDHYHQGFLAIAGQLKKRGIIDGTEMNLKFYQGLPRGTKTFLMSQLPTENRTTTSPPTITQMIKVINYKFDPNRLEFFEDYVSNDDEE
ncbi:hypothetical protein M422DRAFT_176004, partial [Sphaerobolus stellatus SS14]